MLLRLAMSSKYVVLAMTMSLIAQSATAGIYKFTIDQLARVQQEKSCQQVMSRLAQRFKQMTGHKVVGAGCLKRSVTDHLDGVITYEADERVAVVTNYVRGVFGQDSQAFYKTAATCLADAENRKAIFESVYGVSTFYAYCHRPSSRIALRIIGFGTSEMSPYLGRIPLYYDAVEPQRVLDDVQQAFSEKGITIGNLGFVRAFGGPEVGIQYYATERVPVGQIRRIKFNSVSQCQAQLVDVDEAAVDLEVKPMTRFCTARKNGRPAHMHIAFLGYGEYSPEIMGTHDLPTVYADHASCLADKDSVTSSSSDILAGICRLDDSGKHTMLLITAPRS